METAAPLIPPRPTIKRLQTVAAGCKACPLWKLGTQTVFGEGKQSSTVMLVGEQPGNSEDLEGRPFVGPAGALLDRALEEAGIDRSKVYVTNVVKHFKWEPRGKRRIHKKPNAGEVAACGWWLEREIAALRPRLVVALGATAAAALAHRPVSVMRERGPTMFGPLRGFVTVHPSFLLRVQDESRKAEEYDAFVHDLRRIRAAMRADEAA